MTDEPVDRSDEPAGEVYASFGTKALGFLIDFLPAFILVGVLARLLHVKPRLELSTLFILWGFYGAVALSRFGGRTLGMRRMGLRCVDETTGERPTLAQSYLRSFAAAFMLAGTLIPFGFVIPLVDLLWANFDLRGQTLHDKLAKTVVVR